MSSTRFVRSTGDALDFLVMLLAVIWHFWIGFFLAIGTFVTIAAVALGYLAKVENPRYPKKR